MKRLIALTAVILIFSSTLIPLTVFAASDVKLPDKPYEKVASKNGSWYSGQVDLEGKTKLVINYQGEYNDSNFASQLNFTLKESTVLTGIYLPCSVNASASINISIKDNLGNSYNGFEVEIQRDDSPSNENVGATALFVPISEMTLPKGNYTLTIEGEVLLNSSYLIKGYNSKSYEKYKEKLSEGESLGKDLEYIFENNIVSNQGKEPLVFGLDGTYSIDEIIIGVYNAGIGLEPGIVSILNEYDEVLYTGQSYGAAIGDVPNSAWRINPNILLAEGNYYIQLSEPDVISYDENKEPMFYVSVSLPTLERYDFTGTYHINLDTFKTSTLMGAVNESTSSFSLEDFEITVLDKDNEIELIAKYEGMPFSQTCTILEEYDNQIIAHFNFSADLSSLPNVPKIGAEAIVVLTMDSEDKVSVTIEGVATYEREATAQKGADYNTYSVKALGNRTSRDLPVFVMTALGTAGSVGNIPGPGSVAQAAVGALFPPLVGVVVAVLQELLKPKKPIMHDKNWYKAKYPNLSEEELAMVMLADAMGNTDNPDEGDAISIGDNETDNSSNQENYTNNTEHGEEPEPELEYEPEPEIETEFPEQNAQPEVAPDPEKVPEQPESELQKEPEVMILKTSANGAQSMFVKDPVTGEWIDSESGSVLNTEKYSDQIKQYESDKQWNDKQFETISSAQDEHSKILRDNMDKINKEEAKEAYKNTLKSKYGTDSMSEIESIVKDRKESAEKWAKKWETYGNVNAAGEYISVGVGGAADAAIDGLSTVTPGGSYIKAGYKISKGIAGTVADPKKGLNLGSVVEGAIKGGADAATDYGPISNSNLKKFVTNVVGEAAGSTVGAAIRGEDIGRAAVDGLVDGTSKATVSAISDRVGGDFPKFNAVPKMKNVLINKTGITKTITPTIDEFVVKPKITEPIKKSY